MAELYGGPFDGEQFATPTTLVTLYRLEVDDDAHVARQHRYDATGPDRLRWQWRGIVGAFGLPPAP